jgi:hypothetical protein
MAEHAMHTEGSSAVLSSRQLYVLTDFSCSSIIIRWMILLTSKTFMISKKCSTCYSFFKIKPNASFLAFIVVKNYMENIKLIEKANNNER